MEDSELKGGIQADDMGLGKIIQALALLVSRPLSPPANTLVVCTLGILDQWYKHLTTKVKFSQDEGPLRAIRNGRTTSLPTGIPQKWTNVCSIFKLANTVIILNAGWNPACEQQCKDRIVRIGQKDKVMIHYIIANESIELHRSCVQEMKTTLADGVMRPSYHAELANEKRQYVPWGKRKKPKTKAHVVQQMKFWDVSTVKTRLTISATEQDEEADVANLMGTHS
ncbi:hypothetical protein NA57DRAFT_76319 [Rhizodiscina lignyota]|uniref:SNF2 N-terminal domain-containing protein n=1 Tax=Rhizodiscina lignyota TaxID=1504668 RepID=A0A9P4MAV1_9PEZI|nr:hypothetical protein NA57DRAFT_76319 [Rhizodiscina lignyota]